MSHDENSSQQLHNNSKLIFNTSIRKITKSSYGPKIRSTKTPKYYSIKTGKLILKRGYFSSKQFAIQNTTSLKYN